MNTKATHNQKSARKSFHHESALHEDDILDSLAREEEIVAERARARGVSPEMVSLDPDMSVAPRGRSEGLPWSEAVRILAVALSKDLGGMVRVANHHACYLDQECITYAPTDRELYDRMIAWSEGYWCAIAHLKIRLAAVQQRKH